MPVGDAGVCSVKDVGDPGVTSEDVSPDDEIAAGLFNKGTTEEADGDDDGIEVKDDNPCDPELVETSVSVPLELPVVVETKLKSLWFITFRWGYTEWTECIPILSTENWINDKLFTHGSRFGETHLSR